MNKLTLQDILQLTDKLYEGWRLFESFEGIAKTPVAPILEHLLRPTQGSIRYFFDVGNGDSHSVILVERNKNATYYTLRVGDSWGH